MDDNHDIIRERRLRLAWTCDTNGSPDHTLTGVALIGSGQGFKRGPASKLFISSSVVCCRQYISRTSNQHFYPHYVFDIIVASAANFSRVQFPLHFHDFFVISRV